MVYIDDGRHVVPSREDERSDREFEGAGGASWSYELVSSGADRLTAVFTERLDFYDALGAGPRSSLRELLFRDGKIASMSATRWTQRGRNDWGPSFSPDGRRLVFLSGMENVYDLYTIGVDGTGRRRLTYWTEATGR
jgi:hypothetical protein